MYLEPFMKNIKNSNRLIIIKSPQGKKGKVYDTQTGCIKLSHSEQAGKN